MNPAVAVAAWWSTGWAFTLYGLLAVGILLALRRYEIGRIRGRYEVERARAQAFENVFDSVVLTDLGGRIIDWNAGSERLYGYSREEILGKPVGILHLPDLDQNGKPFGALGINRDVSIRLEAGSPPLRATRLDLGAFVEGPDLVVSDVMMPGMGGCQLCRALKRDPGTDFIPVILLTARRRLKTNFEHAGEGFAPLFEGSPMEDEHPDARFLEAVRMAIETNLGDDGFNVEALGRRVAHSRSHLHRRLKALSDESPSDLIRRMRLERAARLLETRAGSISRVAYSVGFKSVAHFSNRFLDHFGVRPSVYREAGRKKVGAEREAPG